MAVARNLYLVFGMTVIINKPLGAKNVKFVVKIDHT
jgi:hypothetical protein